MNQHSLSCSTVISPAIVEKFLIITEEMPTGLQGNLTLILWYPINPIPLSHTAVKFNA